MLIRIKLNGQEFLVLATMILSVAFRDIPVISVYVKMIFPILLFLFYGRKYIHGLEKYKFIYYLTYIGFWVLGLISIIWAARPDYVISESYILFRLYFTLFLIGLVIQNVNDIKRCFYLFNITGIVLIARLIINTPFSVWLDTINGIYDASSSLGRIGSTIGYQPNELGALCFLLLLIATYYFIEKHTFPRLLWIGTLSVLLLFTKSRLSLALTIIGLAVFYITTQQRKSKQILVAVVAAVMGIAFIWAIFSVPVLYDFIGYRLAGVFGTKGQQDASTSTRLTFLAYAFSLFKNNPIIGVGLDNFKYYAYNFANAWQEVYSHSNWGELLADTGIIGTTLYYALQIIPTVRLGRLLGKIDPADRTLCAMLFSFLIVTLAGDIQKMSYDRFEVMLPCMLAYFASVYWSRQIADSTKLKPLLRNEQYVRRN